MQNLDKRLAKLEERTAPTVTPCADYYYAILMTPAEAEHAPDWVHRWRKMHTIDPVTLAEIRDTAERHAAEWEAEARLAWDPLAPPPEE